MFSESARKNLLHGSFGFVKLAFGAEKIACLWQKSDIIGKIRLPYKNMYFFLLQMLISQNQNFPAIDFYVQIPKT